MQLGKIVEKSLAIIGNFCELTGIWGEYIQELLPRAQRCVNRPRFRVYHRCVNFCHASEGISEGIFGKANDFLRLDRGFLESLTDVLGEPMLLAEFGAKQSPRLGSAVDSDGTTRTSSRHLFPNLGCALLSSTASTRAVTRTPPGGRRCRVIAEVRVAVRARRGPT